MKSLPCFLVCVLGFFFPHSLVTVCTCEKWTLKPIHRRARCESPDLGDAGSVTVGVTSFILLLYFKGMLLYSLNHGQKFSSVLSLWCGLIFRSHSFFFIVSYCQSKQPGAGTCSTPEVIWALGVSHHKEVGQSLNTVVCAQHTAV